MKRAKFNIILLFTLLLGIMCSCQEDTETISADNKTGRLVLGLSVETDIGDVLTRGTVVAPALEELTILIINKETSERTVLTNNQMEAILDIGSYTLEATYGENVCGQTPFYYGKAEFVIATKQTTNVGVLVSLASAVIHPIVSNDLLLHYTSHQITLSNGTDEYIIDNDVDYFVPANVSYILKLSGTNALGENNENSWTLNSLLSKTRYTINCNADLPSFTLPEQIEGNAWSKFIYITPMSVADMTSHVDMADKVVDNAIYEASADGVTWYPSVFENGLWIIKNLEPSTTYTLRSRFGEVISSNTQTLTTESAQQLSNGGMESWSYTNGPQASWPDRGPFWKLWYPRSTTDEKTNPGWCTLNSLTTQDNDPKAYCSNSGTEQTTDCYSGNYAAEIKTIGWGDLNTAAGAISVIYNVTPGQLFLGTIADFNNPDYFYQFTTRPVKLAYYCKYIPKDSRQYSVTCKVYDSNKELLGEYIYQEGAVNTYQYREIALDYIITNVKASYITLIFESGENSTSELDKGSISRGSRHTGNKLYIDDVKLLYE